MLQSQNVMESTRFTIPVASGILTRGRLVDIPYKYSQTHESLSENVIDGPRIDFCCKYSSGYFSSTLNPNVEQLSDEPSQAQSHGTHATSPGHVVFGQYISSDNCGHCSKAGGGSAAHHSIKETFPDEYVYVTYMSAQLWRY